MRVLTDEQIINLSKYKHFSEKTSYEYWLKDGICAWGERQFPSFLSANSVTIIGTTPLQISILLMFMFYGTNIDHEKPVPGWILITSGLSLLWFTLVDIMDGNRARRLKCGSPLGRLIDEGGDCITMSNYCALFAYACQFQHPLFEVIIFSLNFIFFMMELKFTITKKLVM